MLRLYDHRPLSASPVAISFSGVLRTPRVPHKSTADVVRNGDKAKFFYVLYNVTFNCLGVALRASEILFVIEKLKTT